MVSSSSSKRKMLAARDDLADQVSDIAQSRGFTLFGMVNGMLELAVKANDLGTSLQETFDTYLTMKAVKEASFTLILESLLYDTAELAYVNAKEKALKVWFNAGDWVGKQYLSGRRKDPFTDLGRELKTFSWNVPEFTIEKVKDVVSVRVLSPRFSEAYTVLFAQFLEGLLTAFGYGISYREIGKGNIRLEGSKSEA